MSISFCGKKYSGLSPMQNTLLMKAVKTEDPCKYFLDADVLIAFGWAVDKKIIPDVGHQLRELLTKKIIKDFQFTISANLKGPEITLFCPCYDSNK